MFSKLPKTDAFAAHCWTVLPLLLTYVLQRCEHVVDVRFMGALSLDALSTHSVFYNEFLIGQAIGVATATSVLMLWRRREVAGAQGFVLKSHVVMAAALASLVALLILPFLSMLIPFFGLPANFAAAKIYLALGLINLVLQAVYGTINAMLVASDQRRKSLIYISCLLVAKLIVGFIAVKVVWNGLPDADSVRAPMLLIGSFSLISLLFISALGIGSIAKKVDGWKKIELGLILQVWKSEVGIALIRSVAPVVLSLQLTRVIGAERFFVTYQLALQLAYFLVLPLQSSAQMALREASSEQSHSVENRLIPLNQGKWFGNYLFGGLLPAEVLLLCAALIGPLLMSLIFGYRVPDEHRIFVFYYYIACMVGQVGNFMVVRLRSLKLNAQVTRNALVSELIVQLGFTQILVMTGTLTPTTAGFVILAYCLTHLTLNGFFVSRKVSRLSVSFP